MTLITAEEALAESTSSMLDNGWIRDCIEKCMKSIKLSVDQGRLSTTNYCRDYEFTEVKYFLEKKLGYLVKDAALMTDDQKHFRVHNCNYDYINFTIFWNEK